MLQLTNCRLLDQQICTIISHIAEGAGMPPTAEGLQRQKIRMRFTFFSF